MSVSLHFIHMLCILGQILKHFVNTIYNYSINLEAGLFENFYRQYYIRQHKRFIVLGTHIYHAFHTTILASSQQKKKTTKFLGLYFSTTHIRGHKDLIPHHQIFNHKLFSKEDIHLAYTLNPRSSLLQPHHCFFSSLSQSSQYQEKICNL